MYCLQLVLPERYLISACATYPLDDTTNKKRRPYCLVITDYASEWSKLFSVCCRFWAHVGIIAGVCPTQKISNDVFQRGRLRFSSIKDLSIAVYLEHEKDQEIKSALFLPNRHLTASFHAASVWCFGRRRTMKTLTTYIITRNEINMPDIIIQPPPTFSWHFWLYSAENTYAVNVMHTL